MQITGTTTITSFGTSVPGLVRECRFAAALTITASASIVLPGAGNIVTAAGDIITFRSLGSGVWAFVCGTKGAFLPTIGGIMTGDVSFNKTAPTIIFNRTASGTDASFQSLVGGVNRWNLILGNSVAEAGSNAGSNLTLSRFSDAGAFLGTVVSINRATGAVVWESRPTFNGATPWDSANLNPAAYLPLTGGSLTGAVSITSSATNLLELIGTGSYAGQFYTRGAVRWLAGAADITSPPAGVPAGSYFVYEWPNSALRFSITPNGGPIAFVGNVTVSGGLSATTVTATSDERLKDVIGVHEPRDLTDIDIYEFNWKDSGIYALSPIA